MRLWSESFQDGGSIPAEYAFCEVDLGNRVRLSGNRNPHLAWDDIPKGTESLALFCIDGDAPQDARDANRVNTSLAASLPRGDFYHWTLVDLLPQSGHIGAGAMADGVTPHGKPGPHAQQPIYDGIGSQVRQGVNDYSDWFAADPVMAGDYYGYDGPCPPWNDLRVHHYVFRLYALDLPRLELEGRFDGPQAWAALQGHILDEAQWIGRYTLNPELAETARSQGGGAASRQYHI
ncbi:YbhB/YbcL family Raf kinase inhibitor-like protein [Oxalobacteraceae bacterium]|nr:YbhB/YbcL family Raf kinase inhibitor-like protein [Oxalobacteraceae bacterium]